MNRQSAKEMLSPSSILKYPSSYQKTARKLVFAILSGGLTTRVLKRLARSQQSVLYYMFKIKEQFVAKFKKFFRQARLNEADIAELINWNDHEDCDIFITMPVRKLGNYHCYFGKYLNDLLRLTHNPQKVLTYVTVDQDDDLRYFLDLKKKFAANLRVRYFINPKRGGYSGGHALHSMMINENPSNYTIWILGASDMLPTISGWDNVLFEAVRPVAHMCIIGGGHESCAGAIHGPNPDGSPPTYWVGTDDFIFASKPTMDTLIVNTRGNKGWAVVGDTWHIDGFFADLVRHMVEKGYSQYFVATKPLFIERDPGGWQGIPDREKIRNETLHQFFEPSRQKMHAKLADELIKSNTIYLKR